MTQYVYLVKKHSEGALEVVDSVLEPKASPVLDFLDQFAEKAGASSDQILSLKDVGVVRRTNGRLIPAAKITQEALTEALGRGSPAHTALVECFGVLAVQPGALFEKAPSGKTNWHIVQELLELRTLLLQARSKRSFSIAICHD
jgi:hypothetical protein